MKSFAIEGKIWRYPGAGGWHFVYVPEKLSRQIKDTARARRGLVRIKATIGDTSWQTSLFPTKDGPYLLAIKAEVRAREVLDEGDKVKISCSLL